MMKGAEMMLSYHESILQSTQFLRCNGDFSTSPTNLPSFGINLGNVLSTRRYLIE